MPTEPKTPELDTVGSRWEGICLVDHVCHCNENTPIRVLIDELMRQIGDALIIPLATGPAVAEKGAWEAAVCRYAGYPTCNTREQAGVVYGPRRDDGSEFDEAWELAEVGAIGILSVLFPAGIVVAEAGVIDHFEGFGIHVCEMAIKDDSSTVPEGYRIETICTGDTIYIKHKEKP